MPTVLFRQRPEVKLGGRLPAAVGQLMLRRIHQLAGAGGGGQVPTGEPQLVPARPNAVGGEPEGGGHGHPQQLVALLTRLPRPPVEAAQAGKSDRGDRQISTGPSRQSMTTSLRSV